MIKSALASVRSMYAEALFPYTPASLKRKVIFIHIPKAAGTAVRVALGEPRTGRSHLPWWVYQQASPRRFEAFYKFAFVRDPIERAFSGYNYLRAGGNQASDKSIAEHIARHNGFDEFVEHDLENGSMIFHPIFRPQSWYLCDWRGEVKVDFVGRFETISQDFAHIASVLGFDSAVGLEMVNKSPDTSERVSKETRARLTRLYRHDMDIFGYGGA